MKKIALAALAICALTACHDDNNPAEVSLYGTWKLAAMVIPQGIDLNNDGTAGTDLVTESGCMDSSTIVFTADVTTAVIKMQDIDIEIGNNGHYTTTCSAPGEEHSHYAVSGSQITLSMDGELVTFTQSGNYLTVTQNGTALTFKKQ